MAKEDNLTSWKPGQSGNPAGKPSGSKNLSTIIRDMLEDGELDWEKVPIKGSARFAAKYGKRGWEAISYVAFAKAMSGDSAAREWLRKSQYGDKMDVTSGGKPFQILGGESAIRSDDSNAQDNPDK